MRPCQSVVMLPVMPPSRASSLPQVLSTTAKARLAGRSPRGLMLIVPTLRVGMHPVTLRVTIAQESSLVSTAERRASPAAFPRGAWERSGRASVEEPGRLAGRLAFDFAVHAPSRGRAQVLRSGHRGRDAAVAAPGHGWPMAAGPRSRTGARECRALARHRTSGARALGYLGLFQVTRCKSGTNSRRNRRNGYAPNPNPNPNSIALLQVGNVAIPGDSVVE
jgi:hypothetical protein